MIEHLKEVAWAFFLVLLFLVGLFVTFGSQIGFKIVFLVCLGFVVIRGGSFYNDTPDRIFMVWNNKIIRIFY
jgi:hypothetical protein